MQERGFVVLHFLGFDTMRVLFVNSGLGLGGAERQVVLLSRELMRLGHEVSIYGLNREGARLPELAGSRVEVHLDQKRRPLDMGVLMRLRRHIAAWRPDVVHGFLFDGNLYSRLASVGLGVRVLGSERSHNYALPKLHAAAYALTSRLCDGVVANSHAGALFAGRAQGHEASRTFVVWNGIDLSEADARLASGWDGEAETWPGPRLRRVCMVGSIKPAKDYSLALRVMRCLVDRSLDWRFVCVGDDHVQWGSDEKDRVLLEHRQLGLEPFVRFVGKRIDALEIIHSADALLVTSTHEGFPNVVLEAMAAGTPVATTDYSDVRRIVPRPWQVVDTRSAEQLADRVERCLLEHDVVVAEQRAWVEKHATIAASAGALLDVYRQCDGGRLRPSERAA